LSAVIGRLAEDIVGTSIPWQRRPPQYSGGVSALSRRALSGVQIRSDQISKEGYRADLSVVISWLFEDIICTSLP
jgi:hypothetical protein